MTLFKEKYRIESTRLPGWDYVSAGWYFVTFCTKNRECLLGDVINGDIRLSAIGEIVAEEWQKTEQIRPNVAMDEWMIMPNHVHGIIVIKNGGVVETPRRGVSTVNVSTSRWKPNSLGSIINQIKSVCTKRIWAAGFRDFAWQPRFFDHIIRDEKSLHNIQQYIRNNPLKWQLDKDNPANLYM
jgi:REP element-mobilizing transposase RayT